MRGREEKCRKANKDGKMKGFSKRLTTEKNMN